MTTSATKKIEDGLVKQLAETARAAAEKAYAIYSNFPVGAAILLENGRIFSGCNVENASLGLTICAERTAIAKAVSECGLIKIKAVAVYTPTPRATAPCGACRQVIYEFGPDCKILSFHGDKAEHFKSWNIKEILPDAFGPADMTCKSKT